jgi:glyoxylase I family protein
MPKIGHIAIATKNPEPTAEFYQKAFGFIEVGKVKSDLATGCYLSDGTLNIAILNFKANDQLGKGLDFVGPHHFGVIVNDVDEWASKLEALGAECFLKPDKKTSGSYFEVKFRGPDRTVFDISEHPWPVSAPAPVKLRHIAIATANPEATVNFYTKAFGFREIRKVNGELAYGSFLSDGTMNMAVLKFQGPDQLGKGLDYTGVHHFGVLVDDVDKWTDKLESLGAECFMRAPEVRGNNAFEVKFHGPDGVVFDIAEHAWPGSAAIREETAQVAAH